MKAEGPRIFDCTKKIVPPFQKRRDGFKLFNPSLISKEPNDSPPPRVYPTGSLRGRRPNSLLLLAWPQRFCNPRIFRHFRFGQLHFRPSNLFQGGTHGISVKSTPPPLPQIRYPPPSGALI